MLVTFLSTLEIARLESHLVVVQRFVVGYSEQKEAGDSAWQTLVVVLDPADAGSFAVVAAADFERKFLRRMEVRVDLCSCHWAVPAEAEDLQAE